MAINPRPVYESDQVVTIWDLVAIQNGYILQYRATRWWECMRRFKFRVALGALMEIEAWLKSGKKGAEVNK